MKIEITDVVDHGTHASEKVLLKVLNDTDLKYFILRDTTYTSENKVSNEWVHAYRFISQEVKKGDKIILYTKIGNDSIKDLGNGNTQYIYYWNLGSCVWNDTGDAAVLYQIEDWKTFRVKPKK